MSVEQPGDREDSAAAFTAVVDESTRGSRYFEFERGGVVPSTRVAVSTLPHETGNLGGKVWDSSIAMAMWAAAHPAFFEGRKVLELGSGVGLGGVAVWCATGCAALTMSDWDQAAPALVDNLKANARTNTKQPSMSADVRLFDWFDALEDEFQPVSEVRVGLGSRLRLGFGFRLWLGSGSGSGFASDKAYSVSLPQTPPSLANLCL